jgi:hypothetical protein
MTQWQPPNGPRPQVEAAAEMFHRFFGRHVADPERSHWDRGYFVSVCSRCGREMIKLPGLAWHLRDDQG